MAVEVARGVAADEGRAGIEERLTTAKELSAQAVDQLRRAIYALHQPQRDVVHTLPELLLEVAEHHRPHLAVGVRVDGEVADLTADADHEIARAVGEALFNVATHAEARRAVVRLRYRPDELFVSVADDGTGDPSELARRLRLERGPSVDGRHRGLANIECRITELGGSIAFRRARIGGVRVEMRIPLPLDAQRPGIIAGLVGAGPEQDGTMATLTPAVTQAVDIMLVDDHAIVRQGLRSILEREQDLRVVAEASTAAEALAVVGRARPAIVLLDLKLLDVAVRTPRAWTCARR